MVELVLTMAIMAVLATIAIPRYSSAIASYRVAAAAQRIVADIRLAQSMARAASASQTIVFTPGAGSGYALASVRDLSSARLTYTVALGDEPYFTKISSLSSTRLAAAGAGGVVTLTFDGFGTPDGAVTMVLQSGGAQRTIIVDSATGGCSIQ
ncbi:hypothetical protein BH09PLA1_BH09PLA1_08080 [soil metagenome]